MDDVTRTDTRAEEIDAKGVMWVKPDHKLI
jgi:hypothetical protein